MLLHRHRFPLLCCSTRAAVPNGADTAAVDKAGAVRQLTWAEVEAMTGSFTSAVVGEGGSSTVYLGRLPHAQQLAAVKVHRSSQRLRRAFRHELHALLRARHPHIVRLLAFCDQTDEGVLVLELAPNGSLHDHLHGSDPQGGGASSPAPAPVPVPWARRVRVALQVARALEYLHEACEPQVVHGDVKASNVLLDAAMDARLCDFGSAHAGFSDSVRPTLPRGGVMVGSPGYVDPHYLRSGLVTKKSDVYSFGVLLLELLTGAPPFSVDDGQPLASIVAPMIRAGGTGHGPVCDVRKLVDKKLGCRYDEEEAVAVAGLAAACVGENPTLRPSMTDMVRTLQKISAVGRRSDGGGKPWPRETLTCAAKNLTIDRCIEI